MGKTFGHLAYIRGIVTYKLSPFEQRAFAGAIKKGVPNMIRRMSENVLKILPQFVGGYLLYVWGTNYHEALQRKRPEDFADDE